VPDPYIGQLIAQGMSTDCFRDHQRGQKSIGKSEKEEDEKEKCSLLEVRDFFKVDLLNEAVSFTSNSFSLSF
jgi:hypothetical protein